jgi:hypothetical protein
MREIATALHLPIADNLLELHKIEHALEKLDRQGKALVLIIDDLPGLSPQRLRELLLLRLFERQGRKLVAVLLLAPDPEGGAVLKGDHRDLRAHLDVILQVAPVKAAAPDQNGEDGLIGLGPAVHTPGTGLASPAGEAKRRTPLPPADRDLSGVLHFSHDSRGMGHPLAALVLGGLMVAGALLTLGGHAKPWGPGVVAQLLTGKITSEPCEGHGSQTGEVQVPAPAAPPDPGTAVITPPPAAQSPELQAAAPAPLMAGDPPQGTPTADPAATPAGTRRIVQHNESLTVIVAEHYPGQEKLGLDAAILANPAIANANMIIPGQVIYLPSLGPGEDAIRLADSLYYAVYGRYYSAASLKGDLAWLAKQDARYLVRTTRDTNGATMHRVFLGGYPTIPDLQEARKSVKLISK